MILRRAFRPTRAKLIGTLVGLTLAVAITVPYYVNQWRLTNQRVHTCEQFNVQQNNQRDLQRSIIQTLVDAAGRSPAALTFRAAEFRVIDQKLPIRDCTHHGIDVFLNGPTTLTTLTTQG